jgi:hypothetical protein
MAHADTSADVQQLPRAPLSAISTVTITSTFLRDRVHYPCSFGAIVASASPCRREAADLESLGDLEMIESEDWAGQWS